MNPAAEEKLVEASLMVGTMVCLLKAVPCNAVDDGAHEFCIAKGMIGTLQSVRFLDDADEPRIVYWVLFPWIDSEQPLRISDFEFLGESLHRDDP